MNGHRQHGEEAAATAAQVGRCVGVGSVCMFVGVGKRAACWCVVKQSLIHPPDRSQAIANSLATIQSPTHPPTHQQPSTGKRRLRSLPPLPPRKPPPPSRQNHPTPGTSSRLASSGGRRSRYYHSLHQLIIRYTIHATVPLRLIIVGGGDACGHARPVPHSGPRGQ